MHPTNQTQNSTFADYLMEIEKPVRRQDKEKRVEAERKKEQKKEIFLKTAQITIRESYKEPLIQAAKDLKARDNWNLIKKLDIPEEFSRDPSKEQTEPLCEGMKSFFKELNKETGLLFNCSRVTPPDELHTYAKIDTARK